MKSRVVCLMMAILMMVLMLPVAAEARYSTANEYFPFTDIPKESWYMSATEFCYVNGFMRGVSDISFLPAGITTREQVIMIMANMSGEDISEFTETSFTDVAEGQWYTSAIAWAEQRGFTNGIGNGLFGLGMNITREEAVTMFYSYVFAFTSSVPEFSEDAILSYDDAESVADWAKDAMSWAVTVGAVKGNDENRLDPKGILTRAQAAQMIYNLQLNVLCTYHEHEFTEATCTEPARCIAGDDCTLLLAPAKGHSYDTQENCESYVSCNDCGKLLYTPQGHEYKAADCSSPMTCTKCGKTEGQALGHTVSEGVCARCNREIFANDYAKLVYYLKARGEYKGNSKQLHVRINYKNGDYAEQYAGYDLGLNKAYIRLLYRFSKNGDTIDMKIYFDSISDSYTYTVDYAVKGEIRYSGSGSVSASAFNKTTSLKLSSYNGDEMYKEALEKLCAPTLRLALEGADYLLTKEIGMGVKALGFVNF